MRYDEFLYNTFELEIEQYITIFESEQYMWIPERMAGGTCWKVYFFFKMGQKVCP